MGGPAFAGAFAGGFLGGRVSESILLTAAGLLVLWQGVELSTRGKRGAAAGGDGGEVSYTGMRLLLGGDWDWRWASWAARWVSYWAASACRR